MYIRSVTGNIYIQRVSGPLPRPHPERPAHTFWKFDEMLSDCTPSLRSLAMATQSLPAMAMTEPPLYDIIDCGDHGHERARRC